MGNLQIKAITAASDNMCRVIDSSTAYDTVQISVHYFSTSKYNKIERIKHPHEISDL